MAEDQKRILSDNETYVIFLALSSYLKLYEEREASILVEYNGKTETLEKHSSENAERQRIASSLMELLDSAFSIEVTYGD